MENNVSIMGRVTIGEFNRVYPGAVIGGEPQDISYSGGDTEVVIGDHNTIREAVTINRATEKEEGITSIGSHNMLMACCHIAHDCRIADHVLIAPATANVIAQLAAGSAENLLTTICLASEAPLTLAPSMNMFRWASRQHTRL